MTTHQIANKYGITDQRDQSSKLQRAIRAMEKAEDRFAAACEAKRDADEEHATAQRLVRLARTNLTKAHSAEVFAANPVTSSDL